MCSYVSACCSAPALEAYKENHRDHDEPIAIYKCSGCGQETDDVVDEKSCPLGICDGSGLVTEFCLDRESGYIMEDGDKPCLCQKVEEDIDNLRDR